MTAPSALSATAAAAAIRSGELSSQTLVQSCLDRIAEREPQVHAWAHLDPETALADACARDTEPAIGPLHGVPVGVKDLIDTADAPTSYGSPIYARHRPGRDAACVARLRDAGAVVLGKTVTTEFALFHPGPTANPRDLSRTPGGSSSGSAAAVADRMVPLALGTQTAGSIVRPAAFCGVGGLKPTFAAIPTDGVKVISPSLDTVGVLARTTADLATCAAVMTATERGPASAHAPRIAFCRTHEWAAAATTSHAALTATASALGLPEITLPAEFSALTAAQDTIMATEVAAALDAEYGTHADQLSDELRALIERGRGIADDDVDAAHLVARSCRASLPSALGPYDALLVPAVIGEAPEGLDVTGDPLFCRAWTLLGAPCVAVPGLTGPDGLPLGMQVVAQPGADDVALHAAATIVAELGGLEE